MVDEIVHKNTGTAFTHREYLIVFRQLKIDILKDLKYSSIAEDGDGICCEDKKLLLMTEAAFKKAMLGEKNYVNKPGFPL